MFEMKSPISKNKFYNNESEKIGINWFIYEYANDIYMNMYKSAALKKFLLQKGTQNTEDFCIYFAFKIKEEIIKKIKGEISYITFDCKYVEDYYKTISIKYINSILKVAESSYNEQLDFCEVCKTACITNKDKYCSLFDDDVYN